MSKMTDKEIAKGLECCADLYDCTDCPCKEFCGDLGMLQQNAIDLINRQQAEIEDYRRNIKQLTETLTGGNGLRIRVDNMIVYADDLEEWLEFCDKQKAVAIKEFAERLHTEIYRVTGDIIQERNERLDEIESSNIVIPFDNVLCGYNSKLQAYDHINGFIHLQYKEMGGEGK